jgi:competence protein ComEC
VRTPAALAAVPLLTGAAAGLLLADASSHSLALCAAGGAVLALVAALGALGDGDAPVVAASVAAGCLWSGLSLGVSAAHAAYAPPLLTWFEALTPEARADPAVIEGVLREDASPSPFGVSITLDVSRVNSSPAAGGVRLTVGGLSAASGASRWLAGRTLAMPALLRVPAMYGDPGVPDEVRALARRGVVLVGSVKSAALVQLKANGSAAEEAAAWVRAWARSRLATYVGRWSVQSGAIAAAILIGDRTGLSDEDQRRLQEAGTYHVIAISGGNIAVLTAILFAVMKLTRAPVRLTAAASIVVLIFYGQLTGSSASVSRAVTGACVYLAGRILDHRGPALNALAVAAAAGVALSPLAIFDAGFILSFGATLGILLGAPRMIAAFAVAGRPSTRSLARKIALAGAAMLVATASAELALIPLSAVVFSRITFAGLLLNFAAIPLMAIVQAASMATLAAAPLATRAAEVAGYVTHIAAYWLVRSAHLVDLAPWLSEDVVPPTWGIITTYYACCAASLASARLVRAGMLGAAICTGIMLDSPAAFTAGTVPLPPAGKLRVVFLDVGQGDATLVRFPDGRTMLVDAGGLAGSAFDIGGRVVGPALRALGVRKLDTLVLTHGDPDHIGGAPAVMKRFAPGIVWEGVPVPAHAGLGQLAAAAAAGHAAWRTVQTGDYERSGSAVIRVLHPAPPEWERQRVRNDDSIVLELRIGGVSIVLPGDVEAEGERSILPTLRPGPVVVVKAAHHGSATSSIVPFVQAAHASAVVFSAGRGNRFGHPAPIVVDRYSAAGALMFRTDEDGAITMDTDGATVDISTWSGRHATLPRAGQQVFVGLPHP